MKSRYNAKHHIIMPSITYTAADFPLNSPPGLQGPNILNVTWADIEWAAITVGRRNYPDVVQHGLFSWYERNYRTFMIYANLMEAPNGRLARTTAYAGLDPSEKSAISYFIGLTTAKLFAEATFGVPWLMHLDVYNAQLQPINFNANLRPDLVGVDMINDWLVMESKGRSRSVPQAIMTQAKLQTASLQLIAGMAPTCCVAIGTGIPSNYIHARLQDPSGASKESFKVMVTPDDFLKEYYRPIQELVDSSSKKRTEKWKGRTFRVVDLPILDVSVGLDINVTKVLQKDKKGIYKAVVAELPQIKQPLKKFRQTRSDGAEAGTNRESPTDEVLNSEVRTDFKCGADGIAIWLGDPWNEKRMKVEPADRLE